MVVGGEEEVECRRNGEPNTFPGLEHQPTTPPIIVHPIFSGEEEEEEEEEEELSAEE